MQDGYLDICNEGDWGPLGIEEDWGPLGIEEDWGVPEQDGWPGV